MLLALQKLNLLLALQKLNLLLALQKLGHMSEEMDLRETAELIELGASPPLPPTRDATRARCDARRVTGAARGRSWSPSWT